MRTTLVIDDTVYKAAKKLAVEQDTTLSKLTTRALSAAVSKAQTPAKKFKMITFGDGTESRSMSPKFIAELRDDDW